MTTRPPVNDHPNLPTLEVLIASRQVEAWVLCLSASDLERDATFLRLDWRFRGAIARALQQKAISRESGSVALLPCTRPVSDSGRETFRILVLGVRDRNQVAAAEVAALTKNIEGLRLKSIGLSASNFGWTPADAKRHFAKNRIETWVSE